MHEHIIKALKLIESTQEEGGYAWVSLYSDCSGSFFFDGHRTQEKELYEFNNEEELKKILDDLTE